MFVHSCMCMDSESDSKEEGSRLLQILDRTRRSATGRACGAEPPNIFQQYAQALGTWGPPGYIPLHQDYKNRFAAPTEAICPKIDKYSSDVNERSQCPIKTVIDTDYDRFPRTIHYARCLCEDCRNNHHNLCEPEWQNKLVLQHNGICDAEGYKVYNPVYIPVPVGCTCAIRRHQY